MSSLNDYITLLECDLETANTVNERLRQQSTDDAHTINTLRETIERLTKERDKWKGLAEHGELAIFVRERDAATARAERLESELRKVEWGAYDRSNAGPYCPCCKQFETNGHRSNCTLAAALEEPK